MTRNIPVDLDALERLLLEPEFENDRTMDEIIESGRETTRLVLSVIAELRASRKQLEDFADLAQKYALEIEGSHKEGPLLVAAIQALYDGTITVDYLKSWPSIQQALDHIHEALK